MSNAAVRTIITDFLDDESNESVVDLTGQFDELRAMLTEAGVQVDAPWLGLEFTSAGEEPVSLTANNTQGLYREIGQIRLHVCAIAQIGAGADIVSRGNTLLSLFRGFNVEGLTVDGMRFNTGPGATLEFEAGYVAGIVELDYHYSFSASEN